MNIPTHAIPPDATAADAVDPTQDPLELVVFNMADAARPGGLVQVADEYGVSAFS